MLFLGNAFSLNMLPQQGSEFVLRVHKLTLEEVRELLQRESWTSVVGHAETAAILGGMLGLEVPMNRATVQLSPGDGLLVAQYRGPRLPEGTTRLPEGASFDFYLVSVS